MTRTEPDPPRITPAEDATELPVVHWPDPSTLDNWWDQVIHHDQPTTDRDPEPPPIGDR